MSGVIMYGNRAVQKNDCENTQSPQIIDPRYTIHLFLPLIKKWP